MILIMRRPATSEQMLQMSEAFGDALIKLAVDVERGILAGGGELHADCEAALLEQLSQPAAHRSQQSTAGHLGC